MESLIAELKGKLIETLGLEDVRPEDIGDDDPLVDGPLELDSIDVLELVVLLEEDYGVTIADKETGQRAFRSLRALATFVSEQRAQTPPRCP